MRRAVTIRYGYGSGCVPTSRVITVQRQLGSVSTEHGHFSEIYIHSPMGSGLGRLLLDPFSMLVYSTRAEDYEAIKRLREQGMSVGDAIEHLVAQKESR